MVNLPPKGYSQLRKGRVSLTGTTYFVTKTARQRIGEDENPLQGILLKVGVPEIVTESIHWLHDHQYINLLSYVVMPDHVHLLFGLLEKASLSKVMQQFGSFTGGQIASQLGETGGIWQVGYHEKAIRHEEEIYKAYQYIVENPLKAGYVQSVTEWPWLYPYPD